MEVKFKRLHPDARVPQKSHESDFCYDCYAVTEEEIAPNVWRYGLGFALQINRLNPYKTVQYSIDGRPRSSVWKTGMILANCTATIDEKFVHIYNFYYICQK